MTTEQRTIRGKMTKDETGHQQYHDAGCSSGDIWHSLYFIGSWKEDKISDEQNTATKSRRRKRAFHFWGIQIKLVNPLKKGNKVCLNITELSTTTESYPKPEKRAADNGKEPLSYAKVAKKLYAKDLCLAVIDNNGACDKKTPCPATEGPQPG